MKTPTIRYYSAILAVVALITVAAVAKRPVQRGTPAAGAPGGDNADRFAKYNLKVTKMSDNLYTLDNGPAGVTFARVGVLTGPDGIFMVDASFNGLTDKVVAAIRQFSNAPIRFLVNTHVHPDHVGGDAAFAKMGVTILSRPEVRDRMSTPTDMFHYRDAAGYPLITFDGPLTFHMDGEDVEVIPMPSAHTDGDTLVRFPKADVIMPGDIMRTSGFPHIQGSVNGMIDAIGIAIGLAGPNTKIAQGHGPMTDRAGLVAHRDMIITVRDRVAKMIQEGKTVDEVLAAHPTAEYDDKILRDQPLWYGDGEPEYKTPERFVRQVYAELAMTPAQTLKPLLLPSGWSRDANGNPSRNPNGNSVGPGEGRR
jgi:cyclase